MKRILVCDDDHEIVQAICVYLTDAGFEIVRAYSGKEALQCVLDPDQQIDLIIMDVMMPEVNGIEATKKIRELYNIPIIMLSAKSEDEDKITGLKIGADDYMTKPFNPEELVARVESQLRRIEMIREGKNKRRNEVLYGKMARVPSSTYYIATFTSGGDRIFDGSRHDHRGNERICE